MSESVQAATTDSIDQTSIDRRWLGRAAALALRGHGGAEPNPLVGCIILNVSGDPVGDGYHAHCGGPHAEVRAITAAGEQCRGGTLYVSLEPCSHHGRTPPCCDAIVKAGLSRVVFGCVDQDADAGGGQKILASHGLRVDHVPSSACDEVLSPFVWRKQTGLPWITVKWAQSIDGCIATRSGHSQWISGPSSRALVHRERGRVDAILTGIGTVRHDDPQLTARKVRKRRTACRVVIDPRAELPVDSALVRTIDEAPLLLVHGPKANRDALQLLHAKGVITHQGEMKGPRLCLQNVLAALSKKHDIATMLVEAGPGLIGPLLEESLVNEIAVFIAPLLVGDPQATPPLSGRAPADIAAATRLELRSRHTRGSDILLRYGVNPKSTG
ncbi:MAG: bifunctional diaminohydroxyphosphoribosylaminopyrimidine deaminase/5-amino-6-(5-phosphoribosylamino)uracil reductase RibD [Phycisphaerales bacterium]|nr:bifunctional diaminohydroxyphosphoribosylaminopyrimidine deaminase/5-amino-6-(5-phosphoribosylamino)uracil reductase RibD [Phycisphaerales bacterium]